MFLFSYLYSLSEGSQQKFPGEKDGNETLIIFPLQEYTVNQIMGTIHNVFQAKLLFPRSSVNVCAATQMPCKVRRKLQSIGAEIAHVTHECLGLNSKLCALTTLDNKHDVFVIYDGTRPLNWKVRDSIVAWIHRPSTYSWFLMIDFEHGTLVPYSISVKRTTLCRKMPFSNNFEDIRKLDVFKVIQLINEVSVTKGCGNATVLCSTPHGVPVPGCHFVTASP